MEKKTKSWWSLLNPVEWFGGFFQVLAAVFGPILRWFGMLNPPSTTGFENIQREDVEDAAKLAAEQEAAVDAITREMSPAEVVRAYARADAAGRATMDLSALDLAQQDWLMRLSSQDLDMLGMSTKSACARSLEAREVRPIYPKAAPEMESAEIYVIPTEKEAEQAKWDFIAARYRELYHAPGVPNTNPRFTPATVH